MSVYIIAEAGVNHNGNIHTALQMIDAAKACGCDCVKFQTFKTEALVIKQQRKQHIKWKIPESKIANIIC